MIWLNLWWLPPAFFLQAGHGWGLHPAFPAPSRSLRGHVDRRTRAHSAAGTRFYVRICLVWDLDGQPRPPGRRGNAMARETFKPENRGRPIVVRRLSLRRRQDCA